MCEICRPPGAARPQRASIGLMAALLDGDWEFADASEASIRREASGLIAAHLQWHLERGLRSLRCSLDSHLTELRSALRSV